MPTIPEALRFALQHHQAGRLQQAEDICLQILQACPDHPDVLHLLGVLAYQVGRHDLAVDYIRQAIRHGPNVAEFYNSMGEICRAQGKLEEAVPCYRQALALKPAYAEAYNNLAIALSGQDKPAEAEAAYRQALALRPDFAEAHYNLGNVLQAQGKVEEAVASYRQAVTLKPTIAEAHNNLGGLLRTLGRFEEAVAHLRQAVGIRPDYAEAENQLLLLSQQICEWTELNELFARQRRLIREKPSANMPPFTLLSIPASAGEQLVCARNRAVHLFASCASLREKLGFHFVRSPEPKLRIGYLSADFREHAVAHLMAELFELHDRNAFEVSAYSYGPDDGSEMRKRIVGVCDRYADIASLSFVDAARRIHNDGIDILVDLQGYTRLARTQILALRPAPIQVNYLGYPGTMGADFIDYIVTDRFITPPEQESFFSEKCVYLPDCYQANDRKRRIAEKTPARAECGLPESGFVFCCFNSAFKITPAVFDVWMRVLKEIPGSVLWLLETDRVATANLRREAHDRG